MKKLQTTKGIKTGSTLRIYLKGFGYSILEIFENNEYYLAAHADNDLFKYINDGDHVEAYLWVEDVASYIFQSKVIGRIIEDNNILFFNHTKNIIRSEERRCLTANVKIPVKFFVFDTGDKNKNFSSKEVKFLYGKILELTDREALLSSLDELPPENNFIKSHFIIEDSEIEIIGNINCLNVREKLFRIIFTSINEKDRLKILDYIFKTYRE